VTWGTRQILILKEEHGGFKMNMQLAVLYSSWYFFNLKSLQFSLRIFHVAHIANYKGFGLGVPPGATYREELSMAILKLGDKGLLHELENK
jgi:hypothetical protein